MSVISTISKRLLIADFLARKYRDEPRPRQGLLRTREFLMKDLYTFDATKGEALQTYQRIRQTYDAFFKEFKIPFLAAEAASGEMGGSLSHEYHFRSVKGEDNIVSCDTCDYVANEELAQSGQNPSRPASGPQNENQSSTREDSILDYTLKPPHNLETPLKDSYHWLGITRDRGSIVQAFLPRNIDVQSTAGKRTRGTNINHYALKRMVPDVDLSVGNPIEAFKKHWKPSQVPGTLTKYPRILRLVDKRYTKVMPGHDSIPIGEFKVPVSHQQADGRQIDLVQIETGDGCPNCVRGTLNVESAVELGHTFHLGTQYSEPLKAIVATKESPNEQVAMQMGCHGIGISRLIAAVADSLADSKGLNWPRVMAPFEVVVVFGDELENEAVEVYDALTAEAEDVSGQRIDALLDDRNKQLGWKLRDADLIGYPVIVVVGRDWKKGKKVEVQCRRLHTKDLVPVGKLRAYVEAKLQQL